MINNLDWIKSTSVTELINPLLIGILMQNVRFSYLVRAKLLYLLNNGCPNDFHWDNTTVEGLSIKIKGKKNSRQRQYGCLFFWKNLVSFSMLTAVYRIVSSKRKTVNQWNAMCTHILSSLNGKWISQSFGVCWWY